MLGCVTTRHLITQGRVIIEEFGIRVYLRCLYRSFLTRRPTTFLECIGIM